MPAAEALDAAGLAPIALGAEGGPGADQRHAGVDGARARRAVRRRGRLRGGDRRRRDDRRGGAGQQRAVRRAHPRRPRPSGTDRRRRRLPRAVRRQRHHGRARQPPSRPGSLFAPLPAAGDGRAASTPCASSRRRSTIEANAVSDNPLIFPDDGDVLSGGNFHAEPVAIGADLLAIALSEVGAISERRIAFLVDASLCGLPPFLVESSGLNSGFMVAQISAAALASENKTLAHPASVDFDPDRRQPGGPRLHGDLRGAAAWRDRRQCPRHRRDRADRGGAGPRIPPAAPILAAARGGSRADPRPASRPTARTAASPRTSPRSRR